MTLNIQDPAENLGETTELHSLAFELSANLAFLTDRSVTRGLNLSQERRCCNFLNYTLTKGVLTPTLIGSTDHVIKLPLIVLSFGAL